MALTEAAEEQVLEVFEDVASDLEGAADETRKAARGVRRAVAERGRGEPWEQVVGGPSGRDLLGRVAGVASRLSGATVRLRQGIVRGLLSEGVGVRRIAEFLGVSHQRISRVVKDMNGEEEQ
ncbi:MAG: helix-turn-helix domain-containing protein [Acidimicrobiia bacterium]|nr:helix-turn-helix domain-containing protein [Acidimicrobiia bacterium]